MEWNSRFLTYISHSNKILLNSTGWTQAEMLRCKQVLLSGGNVPYKFLIKKMCFAQQYFSNPPKAVPTRRENAVQDGTFPKKQWLRGASMELMESGKNERHIQHFLTFSLAVLIVIFLSYSTSKTQLNKWGGPIMVIVGKFRGPSFLHISSFRIVIAQNSVPGCSTVTRVSEEQRCSPPGQRGSMGCASWGPGAVPGDRQNQWAGHGHWEPRELLLLFEAWVSDLKLRFGCFRPLVSVSGVLFWLKMLK